jgi:hypothetical protein
MPELNPTSPLSRSLEMTARNFYESLDQHFTTFDVKMLTTPKLPIEPPSHAPRQEVKKTSSTCFAQTGK